MFLRKVWAFLKHLEMGKRNLSFTHMTQQPNLGLGLFNPPSRNIPPLPTFSHSWVSTSSYHPCPLHLSTFQWAFQLVFSFLRILWKLSWVPFPLSSSPHDSSTGVFPIWYSWLVSFPYINYKFHDYTCFATVPYPASVRRFASRHSYQMH